MSFLGVSASSSGLDLALTQATGWAERHITGALDGSIRRGVYAETVAGYGGQRLMLSRTPIWAIQRMFDDTSTSAATEYCSTDYRIENAAAGFVEMRSNVGFQWQPAQDWFLGNYPRPYAPRRNWYVVYEAGWQICSSSTGRFATTSTGRTLPDDVERAVMLKAAEFYQGDTAGVDQIRVGPIHINYSSEADDPVVELLAPYRRME